MDLPSTLLDQLLGSAALGRVLVIAAAAVVVGGLSATLIAWAFKEVQAFLRIQASLKPVPSAPGSNWLFGHALLLARRSAWDVMHEWVASQPIIQYRIFNKLGVAVGDPESMKRVFQTGQRKYDKDLYFAYYHFLDILGTGLVTAHGEPWQKQRLLIAPTLRHDILDDVARLGREAVDRLSVKLRGLRGTGRAVNMDEEFRLLTLQVIGEAVLSLGHEECDKVFPALYLPVMEEANLRVFQPWRGWFPTPAWFAHKARVRSLNSYLINVIRNRWCARSRGQVPAKLDLLDRILTALEARGQKMTREMEQQLCYEIKTFLLAGHETSAAMLTWTLYELTQHPGSLAKVKEEAVQVFGSVEGQAAREQLDHMDFTVSALKESLRKYTVVPVVVRVTNADDELAGHTVPAGSMVTCVLQAVHALWKSPQSWQPQRFMPGGEYDQFDEAIRPYMFLPFIQGPRNCLGQYFALLEARVVLALLVKRFKFRPLVRDVKRDPRVVPLCPKGGMPMLVD